MSTTSEHTFHIPVLGIAYSIDSPLKVARFGISSVISIVEDDLMEQMREFYARKYGMAYEPIPKSDIDHREKRTTAYLNLVQLLVSNQIKTLKDEPFSAGTDLMKYFQLLPDESLSKKLFQRMLTADGEVKEELQNILREKIIPGDINVNIMTKLDNLNYDKHKNLLPVEYSDGMSALRGFANSALASSVVFSAGLNPRLYGYIENFPDFYPDEKGNVKKKIILKVSDYRSALVQGKFLAKKGLWISEFRIESGLNCGGHAFPTEGHLLGPILEEFKQKKEELCAELFALCNQTLLSKEKISYPSIPQTRITVQGGIGTAAEDAFLRNYYEVDATGWGSPFLLVPEVTNVDRGTLNQIANAKKEDFYLSHSSPLGVPFNNFRNSSSEAQRKLRIDKNKPGSPCYKKYLSFNTEFTKEPICVASRKYQYLKINQLDALNLSAEEYQKRFDAITVKDCLCEGLSAPALIKNDIPPPHHLTAVAICPGPNLAYFTGVFSLEQMTGHIYGRNNLLNALPRPHMFMNELKMYVDYLKEEWHKNALAITEKQTKYLNSFKSNLSAGIEYYAHLLPTLFPKASELKETVQNNLEEAKRCLAELPLQVEGVMNIEAV